MSFSVTKLASIEECDAITALVNQLTESLSVSESVDRLASKRIAVKTEQRLADLEKVKGELASIEAQLGVVSNPQKRNALLHARMTNEAKKFGLESRDGQTGTSALLLKEVEIAAIVSEQDHYEALLAAIATQRATL